MAPKTTAKSRNHRGLTAAPPLWHEYPRGSRAHRRNPMNSSTEERFHKRGWCPRVWTPMESGDGFIVRVHPGFRARSSAEVRTLAALARDFGNGQIEVTRRAN